MRPVLFLLFLSSQLGCLLTSEGYLSSQRDPLASLFFATDKNKKGIRKGSRRREEKEVKKSGTPSKRRRECAIDCNSDVSVFSNLSSARVTLGDSDDAELRFGLRPPSQLRRTAALVRRPEEAWLPIARLRVGNPLEVLHKLFHRTKRDATFIAKTETFERERRGWWEDMKHEYIKREHEGQRRTRKQ